VNLNLKRAPPRNMGLARPPMVLARPNGSSVRSRWRWLIAKPGWRVVRASIAEVRLERGNGHAVAAKIQFSQRSFHA
jgi:hypothetical protein